MIEKNDFIQIERLLSLNLMRKADAALLQEMMVKYVDKHCKVCAKCRGQIRFTQGRLRTWFENNKNIKVEEVVLEEVVETVEETVEEIHPSQMDKRTKGYKEWFKSQQDESES